MMYKFLSIFLLTLPGLMAAPFYYPTQIPALTLDGAVEGMRIENPDISFYGKITGVDQPAVTFSPSVAAPSFSLALGVIAEDQYSFLGSPKAMLLVSESYCNGRKQIIQTLGEPGDPKLTLWPIDGSGSGGGGGAIPATERNTFRVRDQENQVISLLATEIPLAYGLYVYPAVGYCYYSRDLHFSSQIQNYVINFDNGVITESLKTEYQGSRFELGVARRFFSSLLLLVVPSFSVLSSETSFHANQTFGDNPIAPVSISQKLNRVAYQAGFRIALLFECGRYHLGGIVTGDYYTFVPGIFNPREDDDGPAHITIKNSVRYGGGIVIGATF